LSRCRSQQVKATQSGLYGSIPVSGGLWRSSCIVPRYTVSSAFHQTSRYALAVNHRGLEAREFYVSTPRRFVRRGRIYRSPAATWMREVTQDYVTSNLRSLVGEVASGLFVLFDFAQVSQEVIDGLWMNF